MPDLTKHSIVTNMGYNILKIVNCVNFYKKTIVKTWKKLLIYLAKHYNSLQLMNANIYYTYTTTIE